MISERFTRRKSKINFFFFFGKSTYRAPHTAIHRKKKKQLIFRYLQ